MLKKTLSFLIAAALVLTACAGICEATADPADTVIIGKIYTGDDTLGTVEAVAVKDGKIVYAGESEGALKLAGTETEVVETEEGQLVIPGFTDGHTHVTQMQTLNLMAVFSTDDKLEDYIRILKDYIAEHPYNPIYLGKGWINSSFENSCPTADILDAIEPEKPIIVLSSDNHSLWCNTVMMKEMGITKDTQDPEGGKIERDKDGNPNGCFRETAMPLVAGPILALVALSTDIAEMNVQAAQMQYASLGYTSYLVAAVNNLDVPTITTETDVYEALDKENKLMLYTQGAFVINNTDDAMDILDLAIQYKESTAGGKFEVTTIKIFMDGVIEGSTAYLSEPYANREEPYYGESRWPDSQALDKLTEIVKRANEAGLTVHFHSMGDQASKDAIDCIARAYEEIGEPVLEARNALTHLQVIAPKDIERMRELNMVAVLNGWGCKREGFYEQTEVPFLGQERAEHEYPHKSFLNAGVHASFATDFGGTFIVDSIRLLHTIVTRTTEDDDPDRVLNPSECLTMDETLKLMSSGGAYQLKREDAYGKLIPGMDADLLILNQDLLTVTDDQIMQTKILKTMSDGQWVFGGSILK